MTFSPIQFNEPSTHKSFEYLPAEIIINVFTFLDFRNLLICSKVCKVWCEVVNEWRLWGKERLILKMEGIKEGRVRIILEIKKQKEIVRKAEEVYESASCCLDSFDIHNKLPTEQTFPVRNKLSIVVLDSFSKEHHYRDTKHTNLLACFEAIFKLYKLGLTAEEMGLKVRLKKENSFQETLFRYAALLNKQFEDESGYVTIICDLVRMNKMQAAIALRDLYLTQPKSLTRVAHEMNPPKGP